MARKHGEKWEKFRLAMEKENIIISDYGVVCNILIINFFFLFPNMSAAWLVWTLVCCTLWFQCEKTYVSYGYIIIRFLFYFPSFALFFFFSCLWTPYLPENLQRPPNSGLVSGTKLCLVNAQRRSYFQLSCLFLIARKN